MYKKSKSPVLLFLISLSFFISLTSHAEERVVHSSFVEAGQEIPLPALDDSGRLLGWRMVVSEPGLLESGESCEERSCGELIIHGRGKTEIKQKISGRFGAMKALGVRGKGSTLPEVVVSSLGTLSFKNTAKFSYNVEILLD